MKKKTIKPRQKIPALTLNKNAILVVVLFIVFICLRFYKLEERIYFANDQINNAWAAKDIVIDGKILLKGMVAKASTGFFIGPFYYYYIAPFYWLFKMDPITSSVIVRVTSMLTMTVIFYAFKKMFS